VLQLPAGVGRERKSLQLPWLKHAKEEMRKKKPQGTPKTTSERVFSSNAVKPHMSFAAALRGQADHQPHQEVAASTSNTDTTKTEELKTGQSVQTPTVNMFRS
jgi:hypothetical protein